MKKIGVLTILFLLGAVWSGVFAQEGMIDRENLSLKAGPTEAGEGLSLVWIESLVYPKVVKAERVASLGVRTASKVKSVKARFDFSGDEVSLTSNDGLSWSSAYKIPDGVADGVHVVRYLIAGRRGSVQRTVEFFVESPGRGADAVADVSQGEALQTSGWPLTVLSTCVAYSADANRILYSGQTVTGVSKMFWYKVLFEDGREGWVSAADVKEPTEDYYRTGYEAYKAGNYAAAAKLYRSAVTVDPEFVRGYLWLAKSCMAQGDLDAASEAVRKALRLNERDIESRVVANVLAQKYYLLAREKAADQRHNEAVAAFRKVLDLKPDSASSWTGMGESLQKLGLEAEAKTAWSMVAAAPPKIKAPAKPVVAPLVADDSLQILREEKTGKGTKIEMAIKSVMALTRSLGTPIAEKGWQIRKQGEKFLVSYLCEQNGGALESFDWLVDVDTRQVMPQNENARLLMSRW